MRQFYIIIISKTKWVKKCKTKFLPYAPNGTNMEINVNRKLTFIFVMAVLITKTTKKENQ